MNSKKPDTCFEQLEFDLFPDDGPCEELPEAEQKSSKAAKESCPVKHEQLEMDFNGR